MYNFHYTTAEYCVAPYFAEWPMESNFPSPLHTTSFIAFNCISDKIALVGLPVTQHYGEEKHCLVFEVCPNPIHVQAHVFEDKEYFAY